MKSRFEGYPKLRSQDTSTVDYEVMSRSKNLRDGMRRNFVASVIDIIYQSVIVVFVRQKVGRFNVASVWVDAIEN